MQYLKRNLTTTVLVEIETDLGLNRHKRCKLSNPEPQIKKLKILKLLIFLKQNSRLSIESTF
jgi:hypothetical protein